jgi:hypothetical protein
MVWIYGGGFTGGSKAGSGNPAGLIARSQDDGQEGVIYVALNYRLGMFVSIVLETQVQILNASRVGYRAQLSKKMALRMLASTIRDLRSNGCNKISIYLAEIQTESLFLVRVPVEAQLCIKSLPSAG